VVQAGLTCKSFDLNPRLVGCYASVQMFPLMRSLAFGVALSLCFSALLPCVCAEMALGSPSQAPSQHCSEPAHANGPAVAAPHTPCDCPCVTSGSGQADVVRDGGVLPDSWPNQPVFVGANSGAIRGALDAPRALPPPPGTRPHLVLRI
jgi:hypothetical protein